MIRLRNIQKIYPNGFCAIKNLNLEIHKGDIFGIIGYSGAGKSTLIRLINRLEEPTSGEVLIDGVNILGLNAKALQKERQKIGMIFQHFNLLSSMNVYHNVAFALKIAKWQDKDIHARVLELLELVGLSDKKDFYPSQLSGGQKQRVAIARALANHPKILLCDEATSALDTKTTQSILQLLKDIHNKLKITIILITHQIEVVRSICNKVCVIDRGDIIEQGDIGRVLTHPTHAITHELIASMPHKSDADLYKHIPESSNLYELIFVGRQKDIPIISDTITKHQVCINIHFADFDYLNDEAFGRMIVGIEGANSKDAIAYIQSHNIEIKTFYKEEKC
ncbi:methionine ABC transporter ATP-binding protein [Helicobacter mustelae]|uniref:Cell division ATP-binding protein FtsE n=1 Tax=Helicobacter mustelae (strain ATCC 43772 / CCUG 25715 / CIP 103759 / LMG 18044 / NCTC 12198 / R85-136P) TaxID=679897 RepID=D3UJG8_HELM1|nr:ATP-binding cassette domain-containing protein [Helicobacter mustelae]CBG40644.1 D-methionine ABC transporter, ATP-binding protein [Helicobacter mustelae 12198]SQH72142.1 D-methionine ABC transporter ATP-binding protein [Helicobacter mustelae]STP13287.1 D-methionine ABC transporter ATP-binding protein [Helicobacter mustelae]